MAEAQPTAGASAHMRRETASSRPCGFHTQLGSSSSVAVGGWPCRTGQTSRVMETMNLLTNPGGVWVARL